MAGSETDISVSSQALVRLGDNPISSFTETFGAVTCSNVYPYVKRRVLVAYPWRVSMFKSPLLNQIAGSPNSEYKYAYQLPPDLYHGPRKVWNSPSGDTSSKTPFLDFDIIQNQLLTDATYIKIDYQKDVAENDMPHHLVEMMVRALMAEIAFTVTDQQNAADAAMSSAWGNPSEAGKGGYFREAARLDSAIRPASRVTTFPLTAVRSS